jgi:hypothetical protein
MIIRVRTWLVLACCVGITAAAVAFLALQPLDGAGQWAGIGSSFVALLALLSAEAKHLLSRRPPTAVPAGDGQPRQEQAPADPPATDRPVSARPVIITGGEIGAIQTGKRAEANVNITHYHGNP